MKNQYLSILIGCSAFLPFQALAQPTTVTSVWNAHAKICPVSARHHGTYGSTKNFDVTLCYSQGTDSFYTGRSRVTGRSIIVRGTNGRFLNGVYEYKITPNRSGQCTLQVLRDNRVLLSEPFVSHMFMTPPCGYQ